MLRRLFLLVMAIWLARLTRMFRPVSSPRVSGFDPADGGSHPSPNSRPGREATYSPDDVVDGEFEDLPVPPRQ
jgi:hypothetical protein